MRRERYNIYEKAHSRLRSQLLDAGLLVQAGDFGKTEKGIIVFEKIEDISKIIRHYFSHANLIFEAVFSMAPYIIMELEKENKAIKDHINCLEKIRKQYDKCYGHSARKKAGAEAQQIFFELTAASLKIMNREDMIINDLLWTIYSDEEIREIEKRITSPVIEIQENTGTTINTEAGVTSTVSIETAPSFAHAEIAPVGDRFSNLIRLVLSPGKWSFANRTYNIVKPFSLFELTAIIIYPGLSLILPV
ncbi:MAG TPA: hypothetical protein PKC72_14430 [Chitinophagaceae bacterium]|nr:hypothetical protein [Chitinophagaceae bacterium]